MNKRDLLLSRIQQKHTFTDNILDLFITYNFIDNFIILKGPWLLQLVIIQGETHDGKDTQFYYLL